jgi:hypothetical protein
MKVNKTRKAQIIVAALYNMPDYPPITHSKVKRLARQSVKQLDWSYERALKVLAAR